MPRLHFIKKSVCLILWLLWSVIGLGVHFGAPLRAQEAGQLGFSDLQARANALVEKGALMQARPLLEELIKRVRATKDAEIDLDFPLFLVGTAHVQSFVQSGKEADLIEALKWYAALEKEYPRSPRLKDALLKKTTVLRILKRNDEAVELMQAMLDGKYPIRLSYSEETKLLKDLTQTFYSTGQLAEGAPFFIRLLQATRDPEEQALAAAASFEALSAKEQLDEAMRLLPLLAKESEARYRPRLNVALLRTSDLMVKKERFGDASLLLNLIKTTDRMVEYFESKRAYKENQLKQQQAFGSSEDLIQQIEQEIKIIDSNLEQLRDAPTLQNELLVRRARNYTKTDRRYEAFWMFYNLMQANPDHEMTQFYYYAAFTNAVFIHKYDAVLEIARAYRKNFPRGEYYSDVSFSFVKTLRKLGRRQELIIVAEQFLTSRNLDPVAANILAQYGGFMAGEGEFEKLIEQVDKWQTMHATSTFEDGLFYWKGIALLQINRYKESAASFGALVAAFPPNQPGMQADSPYTEDGLLRKGIAHYYAQEYDASRESLYRYTRFFPEGASLDQAYYFLGELEMIAGDLELALKHFNRADSLTASQVLHDGIAFKIGTIHEATGNYTKMAEHFQSYMDRFGEAGLYTDAVYQLGRAYEMLLEPNTMLALYRENIEKYAPREGNPGVDGLIEAYAGKYEKNKAMLSTTVAFIQRMREDLEFREQIVTDRGFLFEYFYHNKAMHQPLYNQMRNHPRFGPHLADDLSPIDGLLAPYKTKLDEFPPESPTEFFQGLLDQYRTTGEQLGEARMLMGLYRNDVESAPLEPFEKDFFAKATPRLLLYIAEYSKEERLSFALDAWNEVIRAYPVDEAAIEAYKGLAEVSARRGDLPAALKYLQTIRNRFQGSPEIPSVILQQGVLLTEMGRHEAARAEYEYILRVPEWRGTTHAQALYQIGQAYMAEEEYAKAHGFFERTFLGYSQVGEWSSKAYLADAEALLMMGSREEALNVLEEAAEQMKEVAPAEVLEAIENKLSELRT
jgi:tetratricopeptide (TPR) repeat protein